MELTKRAISMNSDFTDLNDLTVKWTTLKMTAPLLNDMIYLEVQTGL